MNRCSFLVAVSSSSLSGTHFARYNIGDINTVELKDIIEGIASGFGFFNVSTFGREEIVEHAKELGYEHHHGYIRDVRHEDLYLLMPTPYWSICYRLEELYFMLCIGLGFDDAWEIALATEIPNG